MLRTGARASGQDLAVNSGDAQRATAVTSGTSAPNGALLHLKKSGGAFAVLASGKRIMPTFTRMKRPGSKEDALERLASLPEPTPAEQLELAERLGEQLRALDQQLVDVNRRLAEEIEKVAAVEQSQRWPCLNCGSIVRPVAIPGRRWIHRGQQLEVPADLAVDTCSGCGEFCLPKRVRTHLARKARSR
jgi:hypothetical protein